MLIKDSNPTDLMNNLPENLRYRLDLIRKKSKEFLKFIVAVFPEYTDHSVDHPERAIRILNDWLLDSEQISKLKENEWENFFLHAALYLHDIGMIEHPLLKSPAFRSREQNKEFIRKTHNERSHDFIIAAWRQLDIEDEFQADIIARICLGHRVIQFDDPRIRRKIPYRQTGRLIDIQFLTACVKLADELDLTFERTPSQIYDLILNKSAQTEIEWQKHFSVGGVGPHERYKSTINVWCICRNPEIHRALKQHEAKVQTILSEINRHVSPRFKYTDVTYEIENVGYEPSDYKFRIETSTALDIFTGNPLYSDKTIFIRELIQNSLDACNLRQILEPSIIPSITVAMERDLSSLTVCDNGIGMDHEWIEKYFLPVGISFYKSEEFEFLQQGIDIGFLPISSFGIGILSCFMVADRIIIRTKKNPGTGLEIIIHDVRSYFEVREDDSISQGTEVKVIFKKNSSPVDCLKFIMNTIKCTQWPIEYIYYNGEKITLGKEPVSLIEKLKQRGWSNDWKNYIETQIDFFGSEGYIAMKISWNAELVGYSQNMEECDFHIFQDGIYVCNEPELLPRWCSANLIGRVNLTGNERLELSISRNAVIRGSQTYIHTREIILESVLNLWESVLAKVAEEIESKANRYFLISKLVKSSIKISDDDNIRNLLRKHYLFQVFDPKEPDIKKYLIYDEIIDLPQKVIAFHSDMKFDASMIDSKLKDALWVIGRDARILVFVDALSSDRIIRIAEYIKTKNIIRLKKKYLLGILTGR